MTLALLLSGLVGLVLTVQATRPASPSSRRRAATRRARFVAAHPTQAHPSDVVAALRRAGLDAAQARAVAERARVRGIRPFTLWLSLEHLGAEALSVVVAADLTQRELLTHLSDGTRPDLEELKLFASANGLDLAGLPSAAGPPVRRRRATAR